MKIRPCTQHMFALVSKVTNLEGILYPSMLCVGGKLIVFFYWRSVLIKTLCYIIQVRMKLIVKCIHDNINSSHWHSKGTVIPQTISMTVHSMSRFVAMWISPSLPTLAGSCKLFTFCATCMGNWVHQKKLTHTRNEYWSWSSRILYHL